MYRQHFEKHVRGDPYLAMKMADAEASHTLAFMTRLGMKKTKDGRELAGTRTFEIVVNFVRMAFHEYWEEHPEWANPFDRIKAPKRYKGRRRDVLQENEILKLFMPGVITDALERAVCTAMFWAGLRRAEIFGLKTEDLDWKTPQLKIDHAWKLFGKKRERTLGDPKWHKHREVPFPDELQAAVKKLQEANGIHDFVFCYPDGGIPHGKWILEKLPKWMKAAGIDPAGRRIVPHSARHSLASTLEAAGVPLRYIQEMLGHASMKTTKVYLHTPEGKINELTKKISDLSKAEDEKKEAAPQPKILKIS
jgi:integrase/recombinase XerD